MTHNHLAAGFLNQIALLERDVISLATAMPEHDYGFAPSAGMRTFAEQSKHLATVVHLACAAMNQTQSLYAPGERNNGPAEIHSKEIISEYLSEAFSVARSNISSFADASFLESIPTHFGPQTRAELASGLLQHSYNHYGQMVVYARLRNLVPPTSIPA